MGLLVRACVTYALQTFCLRLGSNLVNHLGTSEIRQLDASACVDKNIGAFDITMNNVVRM